MATDIQHTLFNMEVTPPNGVWPEIAARLATEYDKAETAVAGKVYNAEVTPPAGMWSDIATKLAAGQREAETALASKVYNLEVAPPASAWSQIAAALPQSPAQKRPAAILTLPLRRMVAAAAVLVLITLASWYFFNYTGKNTMADRIPSSVAMQNKSNAVPEAPVSELDAATNTLAPAPAPLGQKERMPIAASYINRSNRSLINYAYYQPIATDYAGLDDQQTVPFTTTPTVAAPLIRDANGKIILDKKLITSPDNSYITITSPNGEQTRISSKFLHIISSLNDDTKPEDYMDFMLQDNGLWKMRFQEWKNKLLNQASLIPTATNFTDILELKDVLQDNLWNDDGDNDD